MTLLPGMCQREVVVSAAIISSAMMAMVLLAPMPAEGAANGGVVCGKSKRDSIVDIECPLEYPVCCIWENDDTYAACCPSNSVCDLDDGTCTVYTNMTRRDGNATRLGTGVVVSVSSAAGMIAGLLIVCICVLAMGAMGGRKFDLFLVERRAELEREALIAQQSSEDDDDEGSSEGRSSSSSSTNSDDDEDGGDRGGNGAEDRRARKEQRKERRERMLCKVCFSKRCAALLLNCGHVCCCAVCATRLTQCPICRRTIRKTVHVTRDAVKRLTGNHGCTVETGASREGEEPKQQAASAPVVAEVSSAAVVEVSPAAAAALAVGIAEEHPSQSGSGGECGEDEEKDENVASYLQHTSAKAMNLQPQPQAPAAEQTPLDGDSNGHEDGNDESMRGGGGGGGAAVQVEEQQ